jgi:hypothetical protein
VYLTPKRLRYSGLGIDLSSKSDAELAQQIRAATALVDAYCNVPTFPQPFSFKGGSVVGEEQGWSNRNRTMRVYPTHTPVKAISRFRVLATESQYVEFGLGDYYINRQLGYVEVVNFALTQIGLWGQSNVPQMGLIEPVVQLDYTYGLSIPVVDEPVYPLTTVSGEEDYTDYMAPDGFWDPDADVTVKVDGSEVDSGNYMLDRSGGFVIFGSAQAPIAEVSVSYTARIPRDVVHATALGTVALLGESRLAAVNMTGIESLKAEELEIRRIGSRSGAEKGLELPAAAQLLLGGHVFLTVRGSG